MNAVDAWFDLVSPTVTGSAFATTHVDELLHESFDGSPLDTSLTAFEALARRIRATGASQRALLVISLPPTARLNRRPPSIPKPRDLRQSPPGLYLCGPTLWSTWDDEEEYRLPVEPTWFTSTEARVHFRVHRDSQARRNDWEFERGFYVHSPPAW